ncbi:uncharacterized protein [Triticum aestivum]|uniref:uncharacterized protein n=1 Tax=Triticum aestivum TaxID=4565 RepID=UPI001D0104AF|nr:uncharacterized protein LOC123182940 [Triticum aestivum]
MAALLLHAARMLGSRSSLLRTGASFAAEGRRRLIHDGGAALRRTGASVAAEGRPRVIRDGAAALPRTGLYVAVEGRRRLIHDGASAAKSRAQQPRRSTISKREVAEELYDQEIRKMVNPWPTRFYWFWVACMATTGILKILTCRKIRREEADRSTNCT